MSGVVGESRWGEAMGEWWVGSGGGRVGSWIRQWRVGLGRGRVAGMAMG